MTPISSTSIQEPPAIPEKESKKSICLKTIGENAPIITATGGALVGGWYLGIPGATAAVKIAAKFFAKSKETELFYNAGTKFLDKSTEAIDATGKKLGNIADATGEKLDRATNKAEWCCEKVSLFVSEVGGFLFISGAGLISAAGTAYAASEIGGWAKEGYREFCKEIPFSERNFSESVFCVIDSLALFSSKLIMLGSLLGGAGISAHYTIKGLKSSEKVLNKITKEEK